MPRDAPTSGSIVKNDEAHQRRGAARRRHRAFSAGLDIKSGYGQPDIVWNHEDPGELLSPKWQKMWKPVVCAVQGMCTAGALYFVNEADVVICSPDATFFDSHVTRRAGLRARTGRADAPGRPGRHPADGVDGQRRKGQRRRPRCEIGLVTEVVAREELWTRAHEIAATIAAKPPTATQGTVKAIWESLDKPYRAAMDQGLIYTRLGNPIGKDELAARPVPPRPTPRIR